MSWLSVLIYAVGAVENIGTLAMWFLIPGMIICIGLLVSYVIVSLCQLESTQSEQVGYSQFWLLHKGMRRTIIPLTLLGWFLYIFLPTKQTLILIAGAEIGTKVIQSEQVQSIVDPGLDLVKSWVKKESLSMKKELQDQIDKQTDGAKK